MVMEVVTLREGATMAMMCGRVFAKVVVQAKVQGAPMNPAATATAEKTALISQDHHAGSERAATKSAGEYGAAGEVAPSAVAVNNGAKEGRDGSSSEDEDLVE